MNASADNRQSAPPRIRRYAAADEAAVRRICFDTAFYGQPVTPYLRDVQGVTELLVGRYLRCADEMVWVADDSGAVVGYLAGCVGVHCPGWRPGASGWCGLVARLMLHERGRAARLGMRILPMVPALLRRGRALRRIEAAYPAHLHINLAASHRGLRLGVRLLAVFDEELRRRGIGGVHVSTWGHAGTDFFRKSGFELLWTGRLRSLTGTGEIDSFLLGKKV